jgi:hypothetical protein
VLCLFRTWASIGLRLAAGGLWGLTVVLVALTEILPRARPGGVVSTRALKQIAAAALAVAATAALGLTAPAQTRAPVTTKGLAPMAACMTPHQAWVWEKAILSVPAVVLIPPHLCP